MIRELNSQFSSRIRTNDSEMYFLKMWNPSNNCSELSLNRIDSNYFQLQYIRRDTHKVYNLYPRYRIWYVIRLSLSRMNQLCSRFKKKLLVTNCIALPPHTVTRNTIIFNKQPTSRIGHKQTKHTPTNTILWNQELKNFSNLLSLLKAKLYCLLRKKEKICSPNFLVKVNHKGEFLISC